MANAAAVLSDSLRIQVSFTGYYGDPDITLRWLLKRCQLGELSVVGRVFQVS
jgi:hypothetical protein